MAGFLLFVLVGRQTTFTSPTPFSPAVFHILLSQGAGERPGYAITREILERTNGKMKLGPGMLYGPINKMLELGLRAARP